MIGKSNRDGKNPMSLEYRRQICNRLEYLRRASNLDRWGALAVDPTMKPIENTTRSTMQLAFGQRA